MTLATDLETQQNALKRWLFDKALPVWWESGGDRAKGGVGAGLGRAVFPLRIQACDQHGPGRLRHEVQHLVPAIALHILEEGIDQHHGVREAKQPFPVLAQTVAPRVVQAR